MPISSQPPTLEQLRAVLAACKHASATRAIDRDVTTFSFEVDGETLAELGVTFYADAGTLVTSLLAALERLCFIDTTVGDYKDSDRKGTTAADCQAFIANELKHVSSMNGLQDNIQRRMFNATLQKLVELGIWRAAVDAERFQKQREAERKRREELKRRAEAEAAAEKRRAAEEFERRQKEHREHAQKESWEDVFRRAYGKGFDGERGFDEAAWAKSFGDRMHEDFMNAAFGEGYREEVFRQYGRSRKQEETKKPKARNKDREPWYTVLGVPSECRDKAVIKSAWRKLCSKWQPRTNADALDPERTRKMVDINTAKDEGLSKCLTT